MKPPPPSPRTPQAYRLRPTPGAPPRRVPPPTATVDQYQLCNPKHLRKPNKFTQKLHIIVKLNHNSYNLLICRAS